MSYDNNESRIRSAVSRYGNYGASSNIEFGYDTEKLKKENRYRVKGQAFPKNINCFNWGACIITPIWGLFNNTPIACIAFVLPFIPYLGWLLSILFSIYCGAKGNEWAWENKEWESINHFHSVQRKWAIWAVAIEVALIAVFFSSIMYFSQVFSQYMRTAM